MYFNCLFCDEPELLSIADYKNLNSDVIAICYHNDRDGISFDDIIEHIGNGEYGSAWRDAKDKEEIQEIAISVLETIGAESLGGEND